MEHYYITKQTSTTGKKFKAVSNDLDAAFKAQKEMSKEIGFQRWRSSIFKLGGGISSVIFDEKPNTKLWRNVNGSNNEWMPKLNNKEGKAIYERFKLLPKVRETALNDCIGWKGDFVNRIGFARNNKTHYGFYVDGQYKMKIPKDCKEITATEYKKLFKIKT